MFLALKEMKKNKGRFVLIISVIVLISYLVFFLVGLANGLAMANRTSIDLWDAKSVILAEGSNANILASDMEKDLLSEYSDEEASPVNVGRGTAYLNGNNDKEHTVDVVLMGVEPGSRIDPELVEGDEPQGDNEVKVSISMKKEEGVKLGDTLQMSQTKNEFKVVGFTVSSKYNVSPVVYTSLKMASNAMMMYKNEDKTDGVSSSTPNMPERVSGLVMHTIEQPEVSDDYETLPIKDFIWAIPGYEAQVLTFVLMIAFLILISSLILGIFLYIITIQKKDVFGIMKIQGISNAHISRAVILQSLFVGVIGIVIGYLLSIVTEWFLPATVPYQSNQLYYLVIGLLMLLTSLLGSFFSVKSVSQVDPLEVLD